MYTTLLFSQNRYNNVISAILATIMMARQMGDKDIDVNGARDLAASLTTTLGATGTSERIVGIAPKPIYKEGDVVKARVGGWTKHYQGVITRVNVDKTYNITFEDGEKKSNVKESQIQKEGEESTSESFVLGQKVRAKFAGKGHFYPATISAVNEDGTFDLKYLDGDWEENAKKDNLLPL